MQAKEKPDHDVDLRVRRRLRELRVQRGLTLEDVARSARIGVDYAGDWALKPWRFFDRDSPYVSTVSAAQRKKALKTGG